MNSMNKVKVKAKFKVMVKVEVNPRSLGGGEVKLIHSRFFWL